MNELSLALTLGGLTLSGPLFIVLTSIVAIVGLLLIIGIILIALFWLKSEPKPINLEKTLDLDNTKDTISNESVTPDTELSEDLENSSVASCIVSEVIDAPTEYTPDSAENTTRATIDTRVEIADTDNLAVVLVLQAPQNSQSAQSSAPIISSQDQTSYEGSGAIPSAVIPFSPASLPELGGLFNTPKEIRDALLRSSQEQEQQNQQTEAVTPAPKLGLFRRFASVASVVPGTQTVANAYNYARDSFWEAYNNSMDFGL